VSFTTMNRRRISIGFAYDENFDALGLARLQDG
jgi:hypothetical protein